MEEATENQEIGGKQSSLLLRQDAGQPTLQLRHTGRFVIPVHDLIGRCGEMDASQGSQFLSEIPAGRPIVQGQKGPILRRRYLSGRKNNPSGCQSMVQYTCSSDAAQGESQEGFLLHSRGLLS